MQKIGTQQLFTVSLLAETFLQCAHSYVCPVLGRIFMNFQAVTTGMDSFEEFEPRKLPLNTPMPVSLSTRAITTRQFFLFCTLYFTSLLLLLLPCSLAQYNFNQPYSCLSPRDFCPFYDTDTEKLLNNSSLHKWLQARAYWGSFRVQPPNWILSYCKSLKCI